MQLSSLSGAVAWLTGRVRRFRGDLVDALNGLLLRSMGAHRRHLIIRPVERGFAFYILTVGGKRRRRTNMPHYLGSLQYSDDGYLENGPAVPHLERLLSQGCRVIGVMDPATKTVIHAGTIPVSARHQLDEIVQETVARLTPFPVESTVFDYRTIGHRIEDGSVGVRFVLAERRSVDAFRDQLVAVGLDPDVITPYDADHEKPFNLLDLDYRPSNRASRVTTQRRRIVQTMLTIIGSFLVIHLLVQLLVWGYLTWTMDSVRQQAESATILQRQLETMINLSDAPIDRGRPDVPMATLLNTLSRTLPDQSWLTSFRVSNGVIDIEGYSPDPEKMTLLLNETGLLEETVVTETRYQEQANADYFVMRARLVEGRR